jgi:iron(III) transport system substrate-binding protein
MHRVGLSRRDILKSSAALALVPFAVPARAAAPPAETITPQLLAAAKKEGEVVWYTAVDLQLATKIGKAFEAKFPGMKARVERIGGERIFQRVTQEYAVGIHAVDAVNDGDAAQFIQWKREGMFAPYVTKDMVEHYPAAQRDPDGYYATLRSSLCVIAYNTQLVKAADAPKSFADLLDPKWKGKIVKANPSYSGTIITSTYALVHTLGWGYLEKLAKQKVLQVASATATPRKVVIGERPIMADGNEYNVLQFMAAGKPIKPVYATEGSALITMPSAIFKAAPHPSAARLFQNYLFSLEVQQMFVDLGGLRSMHNQAKDRAGVVPLSKIKVIPNDPAALVPEMAEIKERYSKYFGV